MLLLLARARIYIPPPFGGINNMFSVANLSTAEKEVFHRGQEVYLSPIYLGELPPPKLRGKKIWFT